MATHQIDEDAPFHHYTLSHRITSWISQNVFGNYIYTCHHGLLKGLKRKGGLGWLPESISGSVETEEHRFWLSLDFTNKVVWDIGSFQGLLAMFFAKTARQVVCFEPNDTNRKRLLENISLNALANVKVRPVGIGSTPQTATMVYSPLMSGGASVDELTVTNLEHRSDVVRQQIEITTVDQEAASGTPIPDFIKIDIEGHELAALQGARSVLAQHRPTLFLEMHGETLREKKQKVRALAEFLSDAGYHVIHVETKTVITPQNSEVAMEGHLYGTPRRP
jgi:FkbM family methyltransferase